MAHVFISVIEDPPHPYAVNFRYQYIYRISVYLPSPKIKSPCTAFPSTWPPEKVEVSRISESLPHPKNPRLRRLPILAQPSHLKKFKFPEGDCPKMQKITSEEDSVHPQLIPFLMEEPRFNDTTCDERYIPSVGEYKMALGAYGTAMVTIGSLITLGLYTLFLEQVNYTWNKAHKSFRTHILWITSVYPFMALMSVIGLVVPRAHNILNAVKITYMSIGISHFADLTLLMFGSEGVMLSALEGRNFNLRLPPLCCCCVCLPTPPITKRRFQLVKWMVWQLPWSQAAYYVMSLVSRIAFTDTHYKVKLDGSFIWLNIFNFASFISGIYALQILSFLARDHLDHYRYALKSIAVKILILLTKLQSFIFDIMGNSSVFPCIPPYLAPQVYKQTAENSIYVLEMLIMGVLTYWLYHQEEFDTSNDPEVVKVGQEPPVEEEQGVDNENAAPIFVITPTTQREEFST
ncbi:organic solute transporter subunit alpha [Oratosquilla oratoria]|uniref:organic solute transporter subunit alpha n=1 Tax=Oratosquilla oratoria TaxID=337810 RepID=UPI003F76A594